MAYVDDVAQITELAHTYGARAGDLDPAGQSATFTEDAEFVGLAQLLDQGDDAPLAGREAIARFLGASHRLVEFLHQYSHVTAVAVDGERATARTQLTEVTKLVDGRLLVLFADLDDELRREDGRWLYTRRTIIPKTLTELDEVPLH